MRRFLMRTVLAIIGMWLAAVLIPSISADRLPSTFLLMGVLVGVGEVVLHTTRHGTAVLLFFLPRPLRVYLLRTLVLVIAASLVTGFSFERPYLVSVFGTSGLLSLLFLFPFAS